MAKPRERYRYNLEQAREMIFDFDGQYNFAEDDSDEGTEGNESDKSSPPTGQDVHDKSPDFIPPSPDAKLPPKKRKISNKEASRLYAELTSVLGKLLGMYSVM